MASRRGSSSCALCEGSNLPSCCALCVNARLLEYHTKLRMMRSLRDSLHARIAARLEAKSKTDEQRIWRASKAHDIMELRDRLTELKSKTAVDKTKVEQASSGLKAKTASLNLALVTLKKRQADAVAMHTSAMEIAQMNLVIKEGEKKDNYSGPYDSICGARLPRGLDPHSIPAEELSASLGYMLHFVNIAVRILSAPVLHVSGFKGSCSNIWQRSSYWSTRQSQSKVYPLFIPRKNACTGGEETSLSESGSSNFGVDSVDSVKKQSFGSTRSNSFNLSGASSHSMERHQYLQRGISLLKTSVTAITTYYYNSLGLDVPSNLSTFEAFSKLLHTLSSSKAFRTAFELNIASRSEKQAQQLNRSIWKSSSAVSSDSSFMDSMHTTIMHSRQPPPELKPELLVHR
ncbi:uncharacterized protein [Zea mays]|uniref:uncharacterized protein isoform X2 n=1 Tax=Zea mays TaxID=4577 RepID=UPI001652F536|nr:uncharacterized protein LOC100274013 isoform X2 [Zea mays]